MYGGGTSQASGVSATQPEGGTSGPSRAGESEGKVKKGETSWSAAREDLKREELAEGEGGSCVEVTSVSGSKAAKFDAFDVEGSPWRRAPGQGNESDVAADETELLPDSMDSKKRQVETEPALDVEQPVLESNEVLRKRLHQQMNTGRDRGVRTLVPPSRKPQTRRLSVHLTGGPVGVLEGAGKWEERQGKGKGKRGGR